PPLALSVPLSRFTSRVGGGSAFYVRPLDHDYKNMKTSKGILRVIGCIVCVLAFTYCYFSRAHEVWSWPIAACLGVLFGLVVLWSLRRDSVKHEKHKHDDDTVA